MQPEADFERQMQIAREIMAKDYGALRAFADLDRSGSCIIDGKTYTETDLLAMAVKLKAKRAHK